jgi:hypothetical protein
MSGDPSAGGGSAPVSGPLDVPDAPPPFVVVFQPAPPTASAGGTPRADKTAIAGGAQSGEGAAAKPGGRAGGNDHKAGPIQAYREAAAAKYRAWQGMKAPEGSPVKASDVSPAILQRLQPGPPPLAGGVVTPLAGGVVTPLAGGVGTPFGGGVATPFTGGDGTPFRGEEARSHDVAAGPRSAGFPEANGGAQGGGGGGGGHASGRVGNRRVYVLRCADSKFYVGESDDVQKRFLQHLSRAPEAGTPGAAWTARHEPLEILRSFEKRSIHDEDNTTLDLMMEHGIENVRGGSYCSVHLPPHQLQMLQHQLASLQGLCYRCGARGHCASECGGGPPVPGSAAGASVPARGDQRDAKAGTEVPAPREQTAPERLVDPPGRDVRAAAARFRVAFGPPGRNPGDAGGDAGPDVSEALPSASTPPCARCGRTHHSAAACFAKFHASGRLLPPR